MGLQILVPLDSSEQSKQALEYAVDHFPDAKFILFHAVPVQPTHSIQMGKSGVSPTEEDEEEAEKLLERIRTELVPADAEISITIESGKPAQTIVAYTENHDVDLVILGSHGRTGASRVLLGSVAESVSRRSAAPVLIVR